MSQLGIVTQVSPLLVRINGDTGAVATEACDDFSGATVGVTEAVVETIEHRRFARLVR